MKNHALHLGATFPHRPHPGPVTLFQLLTMSRCAAGSRSRRPVLCLQPEPLSSLVNVTTLVPSSSLWASVSILFPAPLGWAGRPLTAHGAPAARAEACVYPGDHNRGRPCAAPQPRRPGGQDDTVISLCVRRVALTLRGGRAGTGLLTRPVGG